MTLMILIISFSFAILISRDSLSLRCSIRYGLTPALDSSPQVAKRIQDSVECLAEKLQRGESLCECSQRSEKSGAKVITGDVEQWGGFRPVVSRSGRRKEDEKSEP